jgi:hypothetical protein
MAAEARGTIDGIDVVRIHDGPEAAPRTGDVLVVRGWAHDDGGAAHLTVVVDGTEEYPVRTRMPRPDVAAALNDPSALDCGFTVSVPTLELGDGDHAVMLVASGSAGARELARSRFRLSSAEQPPAAELARAWFETWTDQAGAASAIDGGVLEVPAGAVVRIDGWAADTVSGEAAVAAFALVGDHVVEIAYGFEREDVARAVGDAHGYCGFSASFPTTYVARGGAPFRIVLLGADGVTLRYTDQTLKLTLEGSDGDRPS